MLINADFSLRASVTPEEQRWTASPQPGVERVMLDRVGGEKARATSLVRYAPGSSFQSHEHPGGEEILVLSGTFADDESDYPEGWYLRNPPGSSHSPSSPKGAVIFVKLWQMDANDQVVTRIDTHAPATWREVDGQQICPLHVSPRERVCLLRLPAGAEVLNPAEDDCELLIVSGALVEGNQHYAAGSWLRFPAGGFTTLHADEEGATVYFRQGQLIGFGDLR